MLIFNYKKMVKILASLIFLCFTNAVIADANYVPFPGKKEVRLLNVEAANIVVVNFETWPGFARTVRIKLPDLDIPGNSDKPKQCELDLAEKALKFTQNYLASINTVTVQDMRMETSADEQAFSSVYTKKGSLGSALQKEGLARPSSVDSDVPWCK